jgi:hypothetical protein
MAGELRTETDREWLRRLATERLAIEKRPYPGGTLFLSLHSATAILQVLDDLERAEAAAPASSAGLDGLRAALDSDDFRDAHERAIRDHLLAPLPEGWPHLRSGGMPGDGPQDQHGCDDLCSDAILDRLRAALATSTEEPRA